MSEHESVNTWTEHDGPPPEALVQETKSASNTDGTFCRIPRWIMQKGIWAQLSGAEARLLGAIAYFANRKKGFRAWPRMKTLATMSGLHPETIRQAKKALKERGLIDYSWAPRLHGGHYTWLAIAEPFRFSDDHKKHKEAAHHDIP